jgi:hypothetical protein
MDAPTEEAGDFLSMERVIHAGRKAAKRTLLGVLHADEIQLAAPFSPPPPQDEDVPAKKKRRLDPILKYTAAATNDASAKTALQNLSSSNPNDGVRTTITDSEATEAAEAGALCPVCEAPLGEDVPLSTDFSITFEDKKTKDAVKTHYIKFHNDEPVWNATPKLDLGKSKSSMRTKETVACLESLVFNGLRSAWQMLKPQCPIRALSSESTSTIEDWYAVNRTLYLGVGCAIACVHDAAVYMRGRKTVCCAPSGDVTTQKKWLKEEAAKYLMQLGKSIHEEEPPSWGTMSRSRKLNSFNIFFCARRQHRISLFVDQAKLPEQRAETTEAETTDKN